MNDYWVAPTGHAYVQVVRRFDQPTVVEVLCAYCERRCSHLRVRGDNDQGARDHLIKLVTLGALRCADCSGFDAAEALALETEVEPRDFDQLEAGENRYDD